MNHSDEGDAFDIFEADEDAGEFRPCQFSDDEDDDDDGHGSLCSCPLCTHGDGGTGESHHVIQRMREIDEQLSGKVSDREIFRIQANLYKEHVSEPLKRQGIEAPELTAEDCKKHFSKHYINPKRMMANEIQFINTMQSHLRKNNILSRNNVTGETRINDGAVRQFLQLSKHKMDMLKFYRGALSKSTKSGTQAIKPYSFT